MSKNPKDLLKPSEDNPDGYALSIKALHCNVIVELKNDEFKHEDLGQLNAYVGYFKANEMIEGDNPPIGMLHLPDKRTLEEFIKNELKEC